jgi:hypothetical protein
MNARKLVTLSLFSAATLLLASCADNADGESWQFDEPPPESTVNQALCGDMPGAELDAPVVEQLDEQQWRVRYPVFEQGCGVYQLDAFVGASHDGDLGAEIETRVCNRCDQPQKLVFLADHGGFGPESGVERILTPDPSVSDIPSLIHQGLPCIRSGAEDLGCRMVSTTGEQTGFYSFPSYRSLSRVGLDSGETNELHRVSGFGATGIIGALKQVASGSEEMRVYWPRMRHRDVAVTGLEAASNAEFCEKAVYHGETFFDRPYADPYRLDDKYVRQTTALPSLPDELSDRLRREDQQQF